MRVFAGAVDEPRARRVTDVLLLVAATIGLLVLSFAAVPTPGFASALATYLATWPDVLDALWQVLADTLIVVAVVILVTAAARRRWPLVRDPALAIAAASVVSLVVGRIVVDSWPNVWDSLRNAGPPPWYPSACIAVPASVVITASPHLTWPLRRVNRWVVGLAAIAAVVLGATTTLGAAASLRVATGVAAMVHIAFGSSGGRPRLDDVRLAPRELGVETRSVGVATVSRPACSSCAPRPPTARSSRSRSTDAMPTTPPSCRRCGAVWLAMPMRRSGSAGSSKRSTRRS